MERTLPWSWYGDEGALRREGQQIFRRAWQYVGHTGDLAEPGSFFASSAGQIPVVVTHAQGQFDVVVDRRSVTRGEIPRPRPIGLIAVLARGAGYTLEPNGLYVAPYDAVALRRALRYLLDHPEERARLGAAGRRVAERQFTVERFAQRMRALVEDAIAEGVRTRRAALVPLEGGRRAAE